MRTGVTLPQLSLSSLWVCHPISAPLSLSLSVCPPLFGSIVILHLCPSPLGCLSPSFWVYDTQQSLSNHQLSSHCPLRLTTIPEAQFTHL